MAFAHAPDRRIARHLAGIFGTEGEESDARAAARRSSGGFAAGVASTDHQDIEHPRAL
jgi:hypothetical protein